MIEMMQQMLSEFDKYNYEYKVVITKEKVTISLNKDKEVVFHIESNPFSHQDFIVFRNKFRELLKEGK